MIMMLLDRNDYEKDIWTNVMPKLQVTRPMISLSFQISDGT